MLYPNYQFQGVDSSQTFVDMCIEKGLNCELGDMCSLPFKDNTFDAVLSIAAFHHLATPERRMKALQEMLRVLKPGSESLILEFSKPKNPLLKMLHLIYLRTVVPFLGGLLSGQWKSYVYLDKTIETFLYGEDFCLKMKEVGFQDVQYYPLSWGIVGIYRAKKALR